MVTSDDDWVPEKENYRPSQRRKKSVVPKSAPIIHNKDPALQYHNDFEDSNAPLQRRKSIVSKTISTIHNDDLVLKPHEYENKQPPSHRRKSIAPRAPVLLYAENPVSSQEVDVINLPSRRRKSVVPKVAASLHTDDLALHKEFEIKNPPSRRRKSVISKATSTLFADDPVLDHPKSDKSHSSLPRKRKSFVPKAPVSLYAENPVSSEVVEVQNLPSLRRKSVVPQFASTLHTDDFALHKELEVNNPLSRRRKSVIAKIASTLFDDDPILHYPKSDENYSSLSRKKKSIAPKAASMLQSVDPTLEKRSDLEKELNEYSGNDPLSVWSKYIKWVEQTFIKGERDGQIEQLIERCISTLKDSKNYYNDMRFIEIWLKYASLAENPVSVYNYMFEQKIGYASAGFFIAWAGKLEEEGNMVKAREILQEGIRCKSEPAKKIKSYWDYFKVRAGSKVMPDSKQTKGEVRENHSSKHNQMQEKRSISLSSHIVELKKSTESDGQQSLTKNSTFKTSFSHDSVENSEHNQMLEKKSISIPSEVIEFKKPTETYEQQPSTKNSTLRTSSNHADIGNPVSLKTPNSVFNDNQNFRQSYFWDTRLSIMPRISSVLETQQDCENPPIALFEPPDPMKVPMYDKGKVYAGAQEVSLEEIRAAAWFRKKKTIDYEKRIAEQDKIIADQLKKILFLQQEVEFLKEKLSKVEHKQINFVPEESRIPNSFKLYPVAPLGRSGSKTKNETDSQVQIAQVGNLSAVESCNSSIEKPDAVSHKPTEDSKPQTQRTMKNGYAERVLDIILENGEDSYRSSSGSSKSVVQSFHQENTSNHENNFKRSQQQNQITNIIEEKIITSKNVPAREHFEVICTNFDPFDEKMNEKLLNSLNLPPEYYGNIQTSKKFIKSLNAKDHIQVGDVTYVIESPIAAGSYGKVFVAVEQCPNSNSSKSKVALKICKKTSFWEIYICMTLHSRVEQIKHTPDVCSSIMKITSAHMYSNSIVFTNEYSQRGTLLDLVNSYKKGVPELLTMYIALEMLHIVFKIHECNIIHADVKPDNILIRDNISKQDVLSSLSQKTLLVKFIDFGRAIDLTLFEKGTCFETVLKKDPCCEMIEKKPWVFQLDWFGVLNCIHVLLFSDYMKMKKQANGRWGIEKKFKRYWDQTIWVPLFDELLNIPSCYEEPNIQLYISRIEAKLKQNFHDFEIESK